MRRIEPEFSGHPVIKSPTENLPQDTQKKGIFGKRGRFVMANLILGHGVSGCFGTKLASARGRRGKN